MSAILLFVGQASAFGLASGYPKRTHTDRSAPPPPLLDLKSVEAGINRADCLDTEQRFLFAFTDVPSDATSIELWARADAGSCVELADRTSKCFRVAHWETAGEHEIDNASIVQAMRQSKNVDTKGDPKEVCGQTTQMIPTVIHLHVLAFRGHLPVGHGPDGEVKPAETIYDTFYDVGGPNPPVGFTLATGESLLTVKLPTTTALSDFQKYRVYCFHAANSTDAGVDGASDASVDGASDAASDSASDSAVVASSTSCPAGHPFVPGEFPTRDLEPYVCGETTVPNGDIVMDGPVNDQKYAVAIAGVDKQGNVGILSPVSCETPRATNSFWDNYEAAGGRAGGDCSIGRAPAAGTIGLALVVALVFVARRRKGLLVALPILLCATPSRADESTPSWVVVEARFSPYRPKIDDAFPNAAPYQKTFGGSRRLMFGMEADVTPIHVPKVGSVGFGGLFGYTRATAHQAFASSGWPSDQKTAFDLWLLGLVTTVRVDALAKETSVPVVPYFKLGPMVGLWSSSDNDSISHSKDGRSARGHTFGVFYAAGMMFLLDAIDPQAAKTFDVERGVKHSYIFGELTVADLGGFGQRDVMRVGSLTWTAGIAFEM